MAVGRDSNAKLIVAVQSAFGAFHQTVSRVLPGGQSVKEKTSAVPTTPSTTNVWPANKSDTIAKAASGDLDSIKTVIRVNHRAPANDKLPIFILVSYILAWKRLHKETNPAFRKEMHELFDVIRECDGYVAEAELVEFCITFIEDDINDRYKTLKDQLLATHSVDLLGFAFYFSAENIYQDLKKHKIDALGVMKMGPDEGVTPWYLALLNNCTLGVKEYLDSCTPEQKDRAFNHSCLQGATPLILSMLLGHIQQVILLLSYGCPVNAVCESGPYAGQTPLALAIQLGEEYLINLFLTRDGTAPHHILIHYLAKLPLDEGNEKQMSYFFMLAMTLVNNPHNLSFKDVLMVFLLNNRYKYEQLRKVLQDNFAMAWVLFLKGVSEPVKSDDYAMQAWVDVAFLMAYPEKSIERIDKNNQIYQKILAALQQGGSSSLQFCHYIHALILTNQVAVLQSLNIDIKRLEVQINAPLFREVVSLGLMDMLIYLTTRCPIDFSEGQSLLALAAKVGNVQMSKFIMRFWGLTPMRVEEAALENTSLKMFIDQHRVSLFDLNLISKQEKNMKMLYERDYAPLRGKVIDVYHFGRSILNNIDRINVSYINCLKEGDGISAKQKIVSLCIDPTRNKATQLFICAYLAIQRGRVDVVEFCFKFNLNEKEAKKRLSLLEIAYLLAVAKKELPKESFDNLFASVKADGRYDACLQQSPDYLKMVEDKIEGSSAYGRLQFQKELTHNVMFYIFYATILGAKNTIKQIFDEQVEIASIPNGNGLTLSHVATIFEWPEIVEMLKGKNLPVNVGLNDETYQGVTPLQLAVGFNKKCMVTPLVEMGETVSFIWLKKFLQGYLLETPVPLSLVKELVDVNLLLKNALPLRDILSLAAINELMILQCLQAEHGANEVWLNFVDSLRAMYEQKRLFDSRDIVWCQVAKLASYSDEESKNEFLPTVELYNNGIAKSVFYTYLHALVVFNQVSVLKKLKVDWKAISPILISQFIFEAAYGNQEAVLRYFADMGLLHPNMVCAADIICKDRVLIDFLIDIGSVGSLRFLMTYFKISKEKLLADRNDSPSLVNLLNLVFPSSQGSAFGQKVSSLAGVLAASSVAMKSTSKPIKKVDQEKEVKDKVKEFAKKWRLKYIYDEHTKSIKISADGTQLLILQIIGDFISTHKLDGVSVTANSLGFSYDDTHAKSVLSFFDDKSQSELVKLIRAGTKKRIHSPVSQPVSSASASAHSGQVSDVFSMADQDAYTKVLTRLEMGIDIDKSNAAEWALHLKSDTLTEQFVNDYLLSRLNKLVVTKKVSSKITEDGCVIYFPVITLRGMNLDDLTNRIDDILRYGKSVKPKSPSVAVALPLEKPASVAEVVAVTSKVESLTLAELKVFLAKLMGITEMHPRFGVLTAPPLSRDRSKKCRLAFLPHQMSGLNLFGQIVDLKKIWQTIAASFTDVRFYEDVKIGDKLPNLYVTLVLTRDFYDQVMGNKVDLSAFHALLKQKMAADEFKLDLVSKESESGDEEETIKVHQDRVSNEMLLEDCHLLTLVTTLASSSSSQSSYLREALTYHLSQLNQAHEDERVRARAYVFQFMNIMNLLSQISPHESSGISSWCYQLRSHVKHQVFNDMQFYHDTHSLMTGWVEATLLKLNTPHITLSSDQVNVLEKLTRKFNIYLTQAVSSPTLEEWRSIVDGEIALASALVLENKLSLAERDALFLTAERIYTFCHRVSNAQQEESRLYKADPVMANGSLAMWRKLGSFYRQMSHFKFARDVVYRETYEVMAAIFVADIKEVMKFAQISFLKSPSPKK